jgi:hypothetical protein
MSASRCADAGRRFPLMSNSAHPFDRKREADKTRHKRRIRRLFADPHGRSQAQLQSQAADKLKAEIAGRREKERALWLPSPPPDLTPLSGRTVKFH